MRALKIGWIVVLGMSLAACSTTSYSRGNVDEQEAKMDASAAREERNDEEIGLEGGQNAVDMDDQEIGAYEQGEL